MIVLANFTFPYTYHFFDWFDNRQIVRIWARLLIHAVATIIDEIAFHILSVKGSKNKVTGNQKVVIKTIRLMVWYLDSKSDYMKEITTG